MEPGPVRGGLRPGDLSRAAAASAAEGARLSLLRTAGRGPSDPVAMQRESVRKAFREALGPWMRAHPLERAQRSLRGEGPPPPPLRSVEGTPPELAAAIEPLLAPMSLPIPFPPPPLQGARTMARAARAAAEGLPAGPGLLRRAARAARQAGRTARGLGAEGLRDAWRRVLWAMDRSTEGLEGREGPRDLRRALSLARALARLEALLLLCTATEPRPGRRIRLQGIVHGWPALMSWRPSPDLLRAGRASRLMAEAVPPGEPLHRVDPARAGRAAGMMARELMELDAEAQGDAP